MDKPTPYARRIPDSHEIPADLLELPIWLAWKLVQRPGQAKPGKQPVSPITGREKGWGDPANQADFETARDYAEANGCTGLGIAITPGCGLAGGDLDGCRCPDTGELTEAATAILAAADTYSEVSPSQSGIRFIARGSYGGHTGTDNANHVEFYDGVTSKLRFLTITGNYLEDYPFAVEERDLTDIGRRFFPHKGEASDKAKLSGEFRPVDISELNISDHAREAITTGGIDAYPGGNEAVFGLAKDLIRAGLSVDDTARVLADPANGISAVAFRRRGANPAAAMDWLMNQVVLKAAREVDEEPPLIQFQANQPDDGFVDVSIADVFERPEPPHPFAWHQRIPAYAATLQSADGGTGKSGGALQMELCMSVGADFLGQPVIQQNCLFFSAEDHGSVIRRRVNALCRNLKFDPREVAQRLKVIDATASALLWEQDAKTKRGIPTANFDRLRRYCEENEIGFLVVDNVSDTYGADLWNKSQVTQFVRALTSIVAAQGGAVLLLAHVNRSTAAGARSNGNDFADSVAWNNACRSRLYLREEKESGILTLEHQKSNYGAKAEPLQIERMEEGIGWRLANSATPEYAAGQALIRAIQQKTLLAMLDDFYRRGEWAATSANSPGTNPHSLFNREPGFPSTLKKADTLALFREMERAGFIQREAYAKPNRHPGERWRITDSGRDFAELPAGDQADGQNFAPGAPGASGSDDLEPSALDANPSANALGCAPALGGSGGRAHLTHLTQTENQSPKRRRAKRQTEAAPV